MDRLVQHFFFKVLLGFVMKYNEMTKQIHLPFSEEVR